MIINSIMDLFMHLDKYLGAIINQYGIIVYFLLFFIIFIETGLVITPFLPGDSLLFAAGTFAVIGSLNIFYVLILLSIAAILGDSFNYFLGFKFGRKAFKKDKGIFLNKQYLLKTENFYEKHGSKTIIFARFIPIVRTFAPFVAGIGRMRYKKFLVYNIIGGIFWVCLFVLAGSLLKSKMLVLTPAYGLNTPLGKLTTQYNPSLTKFSRSCL